MTKQTLAIYFISGLLGIAGIILVFGVAPSAAAPSPSLPQEVFSPGPLPPSVPVSLLQSTPTLTPESRSVPNVAILSPKTGEEFEQGQPITVISKAVDPQGLARLYLVANGLVVGKLVNPDPEQNQALLVSQFWFPSLVGDQAIQVIAYDTTGRKSICL
jgi:hypothetical protein